MFEGTRIGDSICVSGACLTVVEMGEQGFVVDCMPETLTRTTLGAAPGGPGESGTLAHALGARLGGHLVLGHVDAVAEIMAVVRDGIAWRVRMALSGRGAGLRGDKGSVAIDGISLTVIDVDEAAFEIGIIPAHHGRDHPSGRSGGKPVNVEADVLARYVMRTLRCSGRGRQDGHRASPSGGLTRHVARSGIHLRRGDSIRATTARGRGWPGGHT